MARRVEAGRGSGLGGTGVRCAGTASAGGRVERGLRNRWVLGSWSLELVGGSGSLAGALGGKVSRWVRGYYVMPDVACTVECALHPHRLSAARRPCQRYIEARRVVQRADLPELA